MPGTIERLGPQHLEALRTLLGREPAHNLYLLGLLHEYGVVPAQGRASFAFHGRFLGGELTAVVFVGGRGGLVVPSASPAMAITEIGRALAGQCELESAVGEKSCVESLITQLANGARPKTQRLQRLFAVSADDLGPFTNPTLRLATEADVEALVPMAAHSIEEVLGRKPLEEDPEGFRARVAQRVRSQRTYVLAEHGQLIFKIDVGSRSAFGAELEGLYTLPSQRRMGHATLCLGQISRHLLSSLPRLTLRIDDEDPSLAGVARKVGYLPGRAVKFIVMH